jgi:hypothetical protein
MGLVDAFEQLLARPGEQHVASPARRQDILTGTAGNYSVKPRTGTNVEKFGREFTARHNRRSW